MKRAVEALLAGVVCLSASLVFAAQQGSVGVSPMPKVLQAPVSAVNTDVVYDPTRWPMFGAASSDNQTCAAHLKNDLSGQSKGNYAPQTVMSQALDIGQIAGDAYRTTAKVIVTWTLRVEAYQVMINPWTPVRLCSPWHGTIQEDFPGGEVASMLYVNGKQMGNEATMTFPALGSGSNTNASDPTITGSVALTAADFGGTFPSGPLNVEIRWINRTIGAQVKTPAYMRNMTIFIDPVTNQ